MTLFLELFILITLIALVCVQYAQLQAMKALNKYQERFVRDQERHTVIQENRLKEFLNR